MIEIEIDGQKLEAQPGETIIQVADKAGIYIPRFCYHKKLSVAASCRMCLVEVEKAPKTLPACATPVTPGMKVSTRSEKALFSQKSVMEFLLINHPLDCPICDQGGECELQDLSLGYGSGISRFTEGKRAVHDENLGPLIASEMTRCIQCSRCVRFGDEIAGLRELGLMGRGEDLEIATYVEKTVQSELSGNIIDLCPVGALTSKPYRFTARAWELMQHEAIAPHDCLGSNIYIHTRSEEYTPQRHVMRVVPRDNEAINETWLSDRDRFSYEAINSPDRLLQPMIKHNGKWEAVDWEIALKETAQRLQAIASQNADKQIGALISPSATTEECYLLQKLMRGMGSDNIDHRLRQTDFNSHYPVLELAIADLEKLNTVLLVGSNIRFEQPLASQRIRKATKQGARVMCINPADYTLNFNVAEKCIVGSNEFVMTLAKLLKAISAKVKDQPLPAELTAYLAEIKPAAAEKAIADHLLTGERKAVLLGAYASQHPNAGMVHLLCRYIAQLSGSSIGVFTEGANSAGACISGALPDHSGLNVHQMLEKPLHAYMLFGVEPELDTAYPALALTALKQAQFVVSFSAFQSNIMKDYAHVILPIATFAETAGTYINVEGKWQFMQPAALPLGAAKAGWEVLCLLGQLLGLKDFDYTAPETICELLKATKISKSLEPSFSASHAVKTKPDVLYRIGQWPIYRIDSLVRHAPALQATMDESTAMIRINSKLAAQLNLTDGMQLTAIQNDSQIRLPLMIDDHIADNQVWIPAGIEETAGFGEVHGEITLKT